METNPCSTLKHVHPEWYKSAEGEMIVQQLYCLKDRKFQKNFGLLERPNISPGIQEVSFKIGVIGKAGSGKTKAIAFLSGKPAHCPGYIETLGIHVKNIYWPVQIQEKACLFKLQFWESGESCSKRYNYISSACLENVDAIAIVVNRADRSSLDYAELKLDGLDQSTSVVLFVMDTDHDIQISDQELSQYVRRRRLPFFHLPPHSLDLKYFAPFYNSFCDFLISSKKTNKNASVSESSLS